MQKRFEVRGWVCVEVYATVKANSLAEAKKKLENVGNLIYETGNWVSPVEIETINEVQGGE